MQQEFEAVFQEIGNRITKHRGGWNVEAIRRFRSMFGTSPLVCAKIWLALAEHHETSVPAHLLYALNFLKLYQSEHVHRVICDGVDEKTFRKYVWKYVTLIAEELVDEIDFENRFLCAPINARAYVSLDATDCPVEEPTTADEAFLPRYFSHKLHGAGLRYEIGLNIRTGDLVWVFGSYPCGSLNDLGLAREFYVTQVQPGELTLADDGYNDINYFMYPAAYPHLARELKAIAQRHETVNNLLKRWAVLRTPFRHDLSKHRLCFYAIAHIIQVMQSSGERLYDVAIDENIF